MNTTAFRITLLASTWIVGLPVPGSAQLTLSSHLSNLHVCRGADGNLAATPVRVESDAFSNPAYRRYNNGNYQMWIYACGDDKPGGCGNRNNWTWDQHACTGGTGTPCSWLVRLHSARPVTVHFRVLIFDRNNHEMTHWNDAQVLNLTWADLRNQRCPEQPEAQRKAEFGWGNYIAINPHVNRGDDTLTGTYESWTFTGDDPVTGFHVSCSGRLTGPSGPEAPGTITCDAQKAQPFEAWHCVTGPSYDRDTHAAMQRGSGGVFPGDVWWGAWACDGTLTKNGRTDNHHRFPNLWLK